MTDHNHDDDGVSRRSLECMIWAGTVVLWTVAGGVPKSLGLLDRAAAAEAATKGFTFLQFSDTHVGFNKPANPHALDTLKEPIGHIKSVSQRKRMIGVPKSVQNLGIGDVIEIRYRISCDWAQCDERQIDRWFRAEIIQSDADAWPLACLVDGQLTEIRPFMTWRRIPGF